jgi:uracil-DNA glycosylase
VPEAEPNDATPFLPERRTLKDLRAAAAGCRGCHLWRGATQTVFGEGLKKARVMLVGEQPGDREDRAGRPFVGPAGRELDRGLEAAGIVRELRVVAPEALVLLGATAAKAILRAPDDDARQREREAFAVDLANVARALGG